MSNDRQKHWDKLFDDIQKSVKEHPDKINKREYQRLLDLRKEKPDLDMDAWVIMHRTELFTPEEEDVHFTDEEFQAIKDELAKHSRVEICDHMEKDKTTRDDLKIKVWPNKTPKEFKVIWYLKIKDMFGEGIKYNQLLPKIQKEYSGFDALVADIQDTIENAENPF